MVNITYVIPFQTTYDLLSNDVKTKYLGKNFLVWGKVRYCYVNIDRLSAMQFVINTEFNHNEVCLRKWYLYIDVTIQLAWPFGLVG